MTAMTASASPIHQQIRAVASRALRQLHEQELLTICDGEFDICDFARLQELAEHRGTWLDQPLPFQNIASTNPEASAVGQPADAAVSRNLLY